MLQRKNYSGVLLGGVGFLKYSWLKPTKRLFTPKAKINNEEVSNI